MVDGEDLPMPTLLTPEQHTLAILLLRLTRSWFLFRLGWNENLKPGAKIFGDVYKLAGSPSQVRGLAINVANWNAFSASPGEFANHQDAPYNKAQDEKRYAALLAPELTANGFPAHFIVDTSRNGVQGLRAEWGNWCNIRGAGFGVRPTTSTNDALIDAFVWIKPGGECDGTSDSSAPRYDASCSKADCMSSSPSPEYIDPCLLTHCFFLPAAHTPAPQAGEWFQEFFVNLVKNANPPL